ncbi:hypothetical protein FGO68_gene1824 [Halteria grandinella]|uniref:Uncharacterized protein n=1 Tax=Halteria grandinella TaxID=5974 RepID=A0A8J8SZV5_HALGN|nr:hypothetical protein FGO68_gene1824 [Halteria grandinella]
MIYTEKVEENADSPLVPSYHIHPLDIYFGGDHDDYNGQYLLTDHVFRDDESKSQEDSSAQLSVHFARDSHIFNNDVKPPHEDLQQEEVKGEIMEGDKEFEEGIGIDVEEPDLDPGDEVPQRKSLERQTKTSSRFYVVEPAYFILGKIVHSSFIQNQILEPQPVPPLPLHLDHDSSSGALIQAYLPPLPITLSEDESTTDLLRLILQHLQRIDQRLNSLEGRMDRVESQMQTLSNVQQFKNTNQFFHPLTPSKTTKSNLTKNRQSEGALSRCCSPLYDPKFTIKQIISRCF